MMGQSLGESSDCIVTLVERKSGHLAIGKLDARTVLATNRAILALMRRQRGRFRTITADNGTEFHGYGALEAATGSASTSPRRTIAGNAARTKTPTD